jgi:hypothetical protein
MDRQDGQDNKALSLQRTQRKSFLARGRGDAKKSLINMDRQNGQGKNVLSTEGAEGRIGKALYHKKRENMVAAGGDSVIDYRLSMRTLLQR